MAGAGFEELFDRRPDGIWRAPGRVNLIGEHTDYNDGLVLPFAISLSTRAHVALRDDGRVRVATAAASLAGPDPCVSASFAELAPGAINGWARYPLGVVWSLGAPAAGGADILVESNVPVGAGLASSAALECAIAVALDELLVLGLTREELVRICRRAENEFVGIPSGALDQSASLLGRSGHALFLDTRSLTYRHVPFEPAASAMAVLVVDTGVQHELAGSEYEVRQRQCRAAAEVLGVASLSDLDPDQLPDALARLESEPLLARRVRHVVTENARVRQMAEALDRGDLNACGPILSEAHSSLRDDYEVSCR